MSFSPSPLWIIFKASFIRSTQYLIIEPPHGKTNNLHRRNHEADQSAFVFATRIVKFLFYLNPEFQASSSFLSLYRPVCVGPVRKPHCWFSHEAAHICAMCFHYCEISIVKRDCMGDIIRILNQLIE